MSSADTARQGAMNSCVPAARTRASLFIVSTCRRKPSTSDYRELPPRQCGMPLCAFNAGVLATIAIPTSSTWTWDQYAAGNFVLSPGIRVALRENLLQCYVVPVDIVIEVHQPVFQHNNRDVYNQDRNRMREIY